MRGIRQGIPPGFVLGRTGPPGKPGRVVPISLNTLGFAAGQAAGATPVTGGSSSSGAAQGVELLVFSGTWSSGSNYSVGNIVRYLAGFYVCIVDVTATATTPAADTTHWTEIGILDSTSLDQAFGSTEGQILQRGASAWQVLAPGTSVQYLKSGGAAALNAWTQPSASSLSDYAATTWTPADNSGAGLSLTVSFATYTVVGNLVTVFYDITYPSTADGSNTQISGLPFSVVGSTQWPAMPVRTVNGAQTWTAAVVAGTSTFRFRDPTADTRVINSTLSLKHLAGMLVYQK